MTYNHCMNNTLIQQLSHDDIWAITPNNRLSRYWLELFNHANQHKKTWQSATILPLQAFLQQWHQCISPDLLLSPTQAFALWHQCYPKSLGDLPSKALAKSTYQAWTLSQQWQTPPTSTSNDNQMIFRQWCEHYNTQLSNNNWVDPQQLPTILLKKLKKSKAYLPKKIIWVSHHDTPTRIKELMQALSQICACEHWQTQREKHSPKHVSCSNHQEEISTMAHWAYQQPLKTSIGCVVTQLSQHFTEVKRTFDHVALSLGREPANFSLGAPLDTQPIVQIALQLLNPPNLPLMPENLMISVGAISSWLLSPWVLPHQETAKRLALDIHLRETQTQQLPFNYILTKAKQYCPRWHQALLLHRQLWQSLPERFTLPRYIETLIQCLNIWGWPGNTLSTGAANQAQHWINLIQQTLRPLHLVYPQLTLKKAYAQLLHETQDSQAPSTTDNVSNIHVLGALEARDMPFDALWVMGCDDQAWPQAASPNPFLPLEWQQQAELPHASHSKEWTYCQELMQSFAQQPVIYSHAAWDEDIPQQASPLLEPIETVTIEELNLAPWQPPYAMGSLTQHLEPMPNDKLPSLPQGQYRGGASLIEHQAQCPFKAFAMHRLQLSPYPAPQDGLAPILKGMLLHESMAYFWQQTHDQQKLLAMHTTELEARIDESIKHAFLQIRDEHIFALTPVRKRLEQLRLQHHMQQWLALERQRPFFKVTGIEKPIHIKVGTLQLNMRIDRIDTLKDGSHLIIDYKTGQVQRKNWLNLPLLSPQLPLYGLNTEQTTGIAFAQIKANQWTWSGISQHNLDIPGITTWQKIKHEFSSWEAIRSHWQTQTETLATSFAQGKAEVAPTTLESCQYCHLQSLCRIRNNVAV